MAGGLRRRPTGADGPGAAPAALLGGATKLLTGALLLLSGAAAARTTPPSPAEGPRLVILDPGHGGKDFGAVARGLREKDVALAVARRLEARLKAAGIPVRLTRQGDERLSLDQRLVASVDWKGAAFVSLHVNAIPSAKASGIVLYTYGPDALGLRRMRHRGVPPMPAPPRAAVGDSRILAGTLAAGLGAEGLKVERDRSDYYVLKNPSQPSVLAELGYLSNPAEAARLADPAYQNRLAAGLARGLARYLKLTTAGVDVPRGGGSAPRSKAVARD